MKNTGMQRSTELTVTKKIGGVMVNGYPRTYRLMDSFGNFATVTATEIATIAVADYQNRVAAFKTHVEGVEVGVTVDISSVYKQNTESCPVGV